MISESHFFLLIIAPSANCSQARHNIFFANHLIVSSDNSNSKLSPQHFDFTAKKKINVNHFVIARQI
jgi:hypothetical protein